MTWTVSGNTILRADGDVAFVCATPEQAAVRLGQLRVRRVYDMVQKAALIEGDDLRPGDLAQAIDAALDAAAMQIMRNDVSTLPGWAQQVMNLALAAGATVDTLLVAMDIDDPDDDGK